MCEVRATVSIASALESLADGALHSLLQRKASSASPYDRVPLGTAGAAIALGAGESFLMLRTSRGAERSERTGNACFRVRFV